MGLKVGDKVKIKKYEDIEYVVDEAHKDNINHPEHYTDGIECWDYIVSHKMNYLEGNIIKYVTRHRKKNGLEDLKKARAYLDKLIIEEENK